ncbi:hypothetical protein HW555_000605 [Spodoptera exigua]|uniref:Uncharacterized protein n=1 Tax=Spodoptera exigua TaxID=7107 RepID=A0A835GTY4_SPOEX|nr:hypothetical protein HW555_000605 [Spodoptera exigua]
MYEIPSVSSMTPEELRHKRKALRDAIVCVGWIKILSIVCYISIFMMIYEYSKGPWSTAIQVMVLAVIPMQIVNGLLLFWGATEEKISALELAVWLCITVAAYNTILSLVGGIFFIRTGFLLIHFLMAIMFALLSVSVFTVLCHDVIVIYTFKTLTKSPSTLTQPVETMIPPPNVLIKNVNIKPPWP